MNVSAVFAGCTRPSPNSSDGPHRSPRPDIMQEAGIRAMDGGLGRYRSGRRACQLSALSAFLKVTSVQMIHGA